MPRGLITSQTATDYVLQDWSQAGLRVPSVFRSFFATLPPASYPGLLVICRTAIGRGYVHV